MSDFTLDLTPRGTLAIDCVTNGPITTNTYFAVSGDEAVIIDSAWDGVELARHFALKHPGVRVVALLCTHGHADHLGGVAGLRRVLGEQVPYLLPAGDVETVGESIQKQLRSWDIDTPDPGEPDRLLNEGDVIEVGDARLQAFSVPGHTRGGMVYFAATTGGNVAFVGDTLFPGSHGRTDLPGGDEATILKSLAKMARLMPADTLCLIGHGPTTTMAREIATNPFMQG